MQASELITAISNHPYTAVVSVASAVLVNAAVAFPSIRQLYNTLDLRKATTTVILLSLFAYAFEGQALITGWPYGEFHYTPIVGPLFFDFIPVLLPVSWVPLALGSFAVGTQATELLLRNSIGTHTKKGRLLVVILGTSSIVATDLVLDPVAAKLGFWVWQDTAGFYGVPWSNFVGWGLSGAIAIILLQTLCTYWRAVVPYSLASSLRVFVALWSFLAVVLQLWVIACIGIMLSLVLHLLSKHRTDAVKQPYYSQRVTA